MALTILQNTKEIAFCKSPQYVVLQEDGMTPGDSVIFTLKLTVWHGLISPIPTPSPNTDDEAVFILVKGKVADANGEATAIFEVSNYVMSLVDDDLYIPTNYGGPNQYNGRGAVWFNYQGSTVQSGEAIGPVSLGTPGVGLYTTVKGGTQNTFNPGTTITAENGKVFGHQSNKLITDVERDYIIPVFIGDGSTNEIIQTSSGTKTLQGDLGFSIGSTSSAFQVGYVVLSSQDWAWVEGFAFTYDINTTIPVPATVYTLRLQCGNGRPKSLKYLNFHGMTSDFPINGSDFESQTDQKTTFNNMQLDAVAGSYDTTRHTKKIFNVTSAVTAELDTGWLFDSDQMISEMFHSEVTWYEVTGDSGNEIYPSNILTPTVRRMKRLYQKQIGYQMRIEVARPLTNNVR